MKTVVGAVYDAYPDQCVVERARCGARNLGDSLFEFILSELESVMAHPKDYDNAIKALSTAAEDLQSVVKDLSEEKEGRDEGQG